MLCRVRTRAINCLKKFLKKLYLVKSGLDPATLFACLIRMSIPSSFIDIEII